MSIRAFVDESDPEKPAIIDYEFFFREDELKNNKKIFG